MNQSVGVPVAAGESRCRHHDTRHAPSSRCAASAKRASASRLSDDRHSASPTPRSAKSAPRKSSLSMGGTIDYFRDTVFNYPTLAEAYKVAALNGLNKV